MKEAKTRCAEFAHIEVDDFVRFVEYCYRGDYACPPCTKDPVKEVPAPCPPPSDPAPELAPPTPEPAPEPEPVPEAGPATEPDEPEVLPEVRLDGWGFGTSKVKKSPLKKKKSAASGESRSKVKLSLLFTGRKYIENYSPKSRILESFKTPVNHFSDENFVPIFLAHARLYSFAALYMVEPLKTLVLSKLHDTLKNFKLFHSRVPDIIVLAQYVYTDEYIPENDEIRKLVIAYIGYQIDTIKDSGEFRDLLVEGGQFVDDFWILARKYII